MQIGIPAEIRGGETRVAATPETVKKFTAKGLNTVLVQSGAGAGASIPDAAYQAEGASIVASAAELYGQSQIVLKVRSPEPEELALMRKDAVLLGLLSPHHAEGIEALARHGLTAFAMEKLPWPGCDSDMHRKRRGCNTHGFGAVENDRPDIARFQLVLPDHIALRLHQRRLVIRYFHHENMCRIKQTVGMLLQTKNRGASGRLIGTQTLEYA